MQEIDAAKSTGNNRVHFVTGASELNTSTATDMWEDITLTHFNQGKLSVVRMRGVILFVLAMVKAFDRAREHTFQAVQTSSEQPESFVEVCLVPIPVIVSAKLDASEEETTNVASGRRDPNPLVGNVILETGVFIHTKFNSLIDWTTKSSIVLAGIQIVSVIFGVVNMLFRPANSCVSWGVAFINRTQRTCSNQACRL